MLQQNKTLKVLNSKTSKVLNSNSIKLEKSNTLKHSNSNSFKVSAKWKSFVQVGLRLPVEHIIFLDDLKTRIMKSRNEKNEVITKNSIIRSLISILQKYNIDVTNINDEDTLIKKIEEAIKSKI